ncbi:MAG: aminodeoxychorismate lyase [Sinimarinibacterium flocculans]|uniref:aminodeoxychorismate lyase n=1 Tax=Sinimarinibacterium flocculans TaxID=985250 RepID=UPI003C5C0747
MSVEALHEGRICDAGAAQSRALHYGDGVFRTLLWRDGAAIDWALHHDKLVRDCAALSLDPPDGQVLADDLALLMRGRSQAVAKIIVARRAGGRGYQTRERAGERWVLAYPAPPPRAADYREGIVAALSTVGLSEQPLLAGIKHLNRLDQVLASRDWAADVDEVLMCRGDGAVVCGSRSNLFAVRDGGLITPMLDRCGVAGIMRHRILDCAARMNLPAREAVLHPADLLAADEAFVCNAVIGIWPLRRLAARTWRAPGPVTRALMRESGHPLVLDHVG